MKLRPLTLKQNLFLLQLLAFIPWMLGALFLFIHYSPEIKQMRFRLEAKEKIPSLIETIRLLQLHQGFCYLRAFTKDPQELKDIERHLKETGNLIDNSFKKTLSFYPFPSEERRLLRMYFEKWEKLKGFHLHVTPLEFFFHHSELTTYVLQFLKEEGEKYRLFEEPNLYLRTLAQVSLLEIPNLVEALAKTRAIGSGALTRRYISQEDKKIFLQNYQALNGYKEALRWTLLNIKIPKKTIISMESSFKLLDDFLQLSQIFLLNDFTGKFSLTGYGYFKLATAVIESFYELHAQIFEEYLLQIEERKRLLLKNAFLSFLFLSVVLGSISLFFYLTYLKLARRLSRIARETQKIANGDLSARVSVDYEDEIGEVVKLLNSSLDELEKHLKRIYFLHYYDPLTGAPNREKLFEDLKKKGTVNLLLVDIYDFRSLNTLYGEEVGDELLKYVTQRLRELFVTQVYRVGPDEFALILKEKEGPSLFQEVEDLLLEVEKEPLHYKDLEIFFHLRGALIGECLYPEKALSFAYTLLKEVKEKAKFADYRMKESIEKEPFYEENILYLRKLKLALEEKRIIPFYQPVFDNKTRKIVKVEALMRIKDRDGEVLPPLKFLEIAKKSGYYPLLTLRMLEEVGNHMEILPWKVSLNLSFSDFLDTRIIQQLQSLAIRDSKKITLENKITLEILETEEIEVYERIIPLLLELKKKGVQLAIDDFGAGYSNLQRLIELGVDYLKIDASIIRSLPESEKARNLVKAIVSFAKEAGIKTIAEFVADEKIFSLVCELEIDYSQGYYFSPPLPLEALLKL
jgi:diguanylate cyclase (GGDEF)-like protein